MAASSDVDDTPSDPISGKRGSTTLGIYSCQTRFDNNRLTLDRTKEQLQQMAAYQLENPDTGAGSTTSPATGGRLGR
jgi:hypothetical protein